MTVLAVREPGECKKDLKQCTVTERTQACLVVLGEEPQQVHHVLRLMAPVTDEGEQHRKIYLHKRREQVFNFGAENGRCALAKRQDLDALEASARH